MFKTAAIVIAVLLSSVVLAQEPAARPEPTPSAPVSSDGTMKVAPIKPISEPDAAKPLPDIHQLLLDVERNQRAAETIQNTYTYHVHRVQQDMNKDGSVKKSTVTDADSFSVDGVRVNRTTAINGKPLSADEARKESERVDKEVAKGREHRSKEESQGRETNARGDDEISASRILELGKFSNPRRETVDGRSTIVVDYTGDSQAKTHNTAEAIFRDLVGTVWIDETDRAMVRAEGQFANDFKVGAGLVADIHKGLNFSFRAAKVNGETWLPAQIEGRGSARALLFFSFNGALSVTTSDYRKFRSSAEIVAGTENKVDSDGNPIVESAPQAPPAAQLPK